MIDFPVGGGEMGELIRAFDWSGTALGPIANWPPALRTATNIVLQAPSPLVMLWGPDGVMIYNDAYSVFAGQRHPRLLGSKVLEGWAEVADFNAHVLKVCLAGDTLSFKDQELTLYRNNVPEQVFMDLNYGPVLGDDQKPAGVLAIVVETTGRVTAERLFAEQSAATREAHKRLSALVDATADIIYRMSPDWREMWVLEGRGVLRDTATPSIAWLDEYLFPEDQPAILEVINEAVRHKHTFQLEHRVRQTDGSMGWTFSRAIPLLDEAGEISEWFGAASDVTARRQAEEHLRLVINELNHRVKNTLALTQAMATQSFRDTDDLKAAEQKFIARLKALASATDLMTGRNWVDASLRTTIEGAIRPYRREELRRCEITGPEVGLTPKTAISLSMALHELAANATKYGAWSGPAGTVAISWTVTGNHDTARLKLEWRESGGPEVSPPTRRGFGSRLIERGLAAEMGGVVRILFEPAGVVCVIDAPLKQDL